MNRHNNGLNDSDKIFVTVALWIASVAFLAAELTMPMLPDKVTIFYKTADETAQYFSKYNNLFIVFISMIPAAVMLIAASLKKRNKMQQNFVSIMLFGIMLSLCFAGVTIYGICQQFAASSTKKLIDDNSLISLAMAFLFSMTFASAPTVFHSRKFVAGAANRSPLRAHIHYSVDRNWTLGAYGFLVTVLVCSALPGAFSYIPLAAFLIFEIVFTVMHAKRILKRKMEALIFDQIEN